VAVLVIDLRLNNGPNESTGLPPGRYEVLKPNCRNETIQFLKDNLRRGTGTAWRDRVEFVGLGFDWQNAALVHGFEGTLGYNPFRLEDLSKATGARDYIAGPDQKQFSPLFPSYTSLLANLLGLRFVISGIPIEQFDHNLKPGQLKLVYRTSDGYVYENPDPIPRVLFVNDWMHADFDGLIASGSWPSDFDARRVVLLEGPPQGDEAVMAMTAKPAPTSEVRIRRYENTRVVIEVEASRPGFVVLHDLWHFWWTADVDGIDAKIYRANVLFRAVQVPAGHHVVTFEFTPISGAIADVSDKLFEPPH
jgi:hypothetical protein